MSGYNWDCYEVVKCNNGDAIKFCLGLCIMGVAEKFIGPGVKYLCFVQKKKKLDSPSKKFELFFNIILTFSKL